MIGIEVASQSARRLCAPPSGLPQLLSLSLSDDAPHFWFLEPNFLRVSLITQGLLPFNHQ